LDRLNVKVSVILQRLVSFLLELKNCIVSEFFVIKFAGGFGPCKFSWIMFGSEVAMALWPAKTEGFAIIPNEHYTVAWVYWA